MTFVHYPSSYEALHGEPPGGLNYWVQKGYIPLGTTKPYESYKGEIPDKDIVQIKFDPKNAPTTSRKAMNILLLAGSGDGKSQIMKTIWYVLHNAGYFCGYIDPKSTDSGRAVMKWEGSPRLPPNMVPEGIPREHFLPVWATKNMDHLIHNFRIYAGRLHAIPEKEMWQGLGMSSMAASKTSGIIQRRGDRITVDVLRDLLMAMPKEELNRQSFDNAMRVLTDMEDMRMIDEDIKELDLYALWRSGKSVCISYNNASRTPLTFDVGLKIATSASYYFSKRNRNPIMWFLDDAYFYADKFEHIPYNYALEQIKQIGFNYRSLGVYNVLAVQTLSIVDQAAAEGYRIKLISPLFSNPESLKNINVPPSAREYLNKGMLKTDSSKHLMQWLLIDESNKVVPFYPFTPPSNHFVEVYHEKEWREDVSVG